MSTRNEVIAKVRPILAAEPELRWGYLFGSCARGETPRDVDLAVMPRAEAYPTAVSWGALIAALDRLQAGVRTLRPRPPEGVGRTAAQPERLMRGNDVIRRRLDVLLDALVDLRRYRERFDARTLTADRDAQHMVSRAMYVAAQAAIDIALHASAAAEQGQSATYQEAFERLADTGVLEGPSARRLMGWAGLRNVLAHQYASIDFARIAATRAGELGDLEDFAVIAANQI